MTEETPTAAPDVEEPKVEVKLGDKDTTNLDSMSKAELKNLLGEMAALTQTITSLTILDSAKQEQPRETTTSKEEMAPLKGEDTAKTTEEEDEIEWHQPFAESCFTLLYMCDKTTHGFWHGLFCVGVQILTITLVLVDIVDWESADNPLIIPPMVESTVTIAQAVALYLAVPFMQDLIEAVLKLHDGFYPELLEERPEANYITWLLSCVLQLIAGCGLLVDIFILTMQAESVIGIMLNFAALHFMAEIDDLGFKVAAMGFVTDSLQKQAEECTDFKVPKRYKGYIFRRVCYVLALCGMFVGYGFCKHRQMVGQDLATYLYVQFGDTYTPELGYYSGILQAKITYTGQYRRYEDIGTSTMHLGYCSSEGAWTFSHGNTNPCEEIFAKSEETRAYDVTSVQDYQWLVLDNETKRFTSFESFKLVNRDCEPDLCQGTCVDDLCQCPEGKFGLDCEYEDVCDELAVVVGTTFPADILDYATAQRYELFRNPQTGEPVRVYNMPVFYSNDTIPANYIFYGGLRWVLTSELDVEGMSGEEMAYSGVHFPDDTAEYLESDGFHGHHNQKHHSNFLSDPMHFQSSGFLPTPAGLHWYIADPTDGELSRSTEYTPGDPITAILECQNCAQGGTCDPYGGECNAETGRCDCYEGFSGGRCDQQQNCYDQPWPCGGNGVCDLTGECRCFPPYYGKLCEINYWCVEENGKCFNGGTCNPSNVSTATFYCDCPDPTTSGNACEKRQDCEVFGCRNGGECIGQTGKCSCPEPFTGYGCDLVDDSKVESLCQADRDCQNGSCNQATGLCDCEDPGAIGALCEMKFMDTCEETTCQNGGSCNATTGLCDCEAPYTGLYCSDVPDCETDGDCVGSGTCNTETGHCNCEDPFDAGKLCQKSEHCRDGGCYNPGVCKPTGFCECDFPYTGALCELVLDDGITLF